MCHSRQLGHSEKVSASTEVMRGCLLQVSTTPLIFFLFFHCRAKYGRIIDAKDAIMRINQAPVHGYEELVGARTTYRMLNNKVTPFTQGECSSGVHIECGIQVSYYVSYYANIFCALFAVDHGVLRGQCAQHRCSRGDKAGANVSPANPCAHARLIFAV